MRGLAVLVMLVVWVEAVPSQNKSLYGFYRNMGAQDQLNEIQYGGHSTRRVFGGEAAELSAYPSACALLDRYTRERCSGTILQSHWALTAAHCVTSHVSYVKYNARRLSPMSGNTAEVAYLYKHPGYRVVQEDEGRGMDVTGLYNDIGLVQTRTKMSLIARMPRSPISAMLLFNPYDLKNQEVDVLGFGRTERTLEGEELFHTKLRVVFCDRDTWYPCMCGVAAGRDPRGVCSGDSGGPVLYQGVQVAVTSMGPLECQGVGQGRTAVMPSEASTSVFTPLFTYATLINDTIHGVNTNVRMERISSASCRLCLSPITLALLLAIMC